MNDIEVMNTDILPLLDKIRYEDEKYYLRDGEYWRESTTQNICVIFRDAFKILYDYYTPRNILEEIRLHCVEYDLHPHPKARK